MTIPGYENFAQRILRRKMVYDLLIVFAAFFGGGASAMRAYHAADAADQAVDGDRGCNLDRGAGHLFLTGGIVVAIIACFKFKAEWSNAEDAETPRDLDGCLHTLLAMLLASFEGPGNSGLRITIHLPIENWQRLQQIVEYVGDKRAGAPTAGRKFSAQPGVIGECFRSHKIADGSWDGNNYELLVKELVDRWRYQDGTARALNADSRAWLAVPILDNLCVCGATDLAGILYLDSTIPEFFDDERITLVSYAAKGIAEYVKRRYS
jgi:hypothetical protein